MGYMFKGAESFDQPIGDWDVSSVKVIGDMFYNAISFNQDLSKWDLNGKKISDVMFDNCPIKKEYKPKIKR